MIYLKLFLEFSKIGLFAFGGAYGSIAVIKDAVVENGWASEAMLMNLIAFSETTPGPIMINIAGYIGGQQAGLAGMACATLGVVLPSFLIVLGIAAVLRDWIKKGPVQAVLRGVKPCLVGVILATGLHMVLEALAAEGGGLDWVACLIAAVLMLAEGVGQRKKAALSPVMMIALAGACGGILYAVA